jgi:hypothetical protein
MLPKTPSRLAPLTASLLQLVAEKPWASHLVIGGGVALAHYIEYRPTFDADFWWVENLSAPEKDATVAALAELLSAAAQPCYDGASVSTRRWGDTVSIDVNWKGKRVYSCQIAARTTQLFPYVSSAFGGLRLETLEENLASKMSALVGRGSARDFLDVYTVVESGRLSWKRCWQLWAARNPGVDSALARTQVALHLQGIEQRRPLGQMDEASRARATAVREFFRTHLAVPPGRETPEDKT